MKNQKSEDDNANIYTEDGYQLITDFKTYAEIWQCDEGETASLNVNIYRETNEDYEEPNMNKLIRAWNAFNEVVPTFEDYYDGKNERMLLQSIFSKELQIAKKVGIAYTDIPIGIFCSTREDLIKLDIFLERIVNIWKPKETRIRRFLKFLRRLKFQPPWRIE